MKKSVPLVPFAKERLRLAKTTIALVKALNRSISATPNKAGNQPADLDLVVVAFAVSIGHIEHRPMSASKIALYLDLPRTTVSRKLDELVRRDVVVQSGRHYLLSPHRLNTSEAHLLRIAAVTALFGRD